MSACGRRKGRLLRHLLWRVRRSQHCGHIEGGLWGSQLSGVRGEVWQHRGSRRGGRGVAWSTGRRVYGRGLLRSGAIKSVLRGRRRELLRRHREVGCHRGPRVAVRRWVISGRRQRGGGRGSNNSTSGIFTFARASLYLVRKLRRSQSISARGDGRRARRIRLPLLRSGSRSRGKPSQRAAASFLMRSNRGRRRL